MQCSEIVIQLWFHFCWLLLDYQTPTCALWLSVHMGQVKNMKTSVCPFIAPPFAVTHYDTSRMEGQAKLTLWLVTCLDGLSSSTGWPWVTTTFIKPDYHQSHRSARVIGTARIVCESMKWSGVCPSLSVRPINLLQKWHAGRRYRSTATGTQQHLQTVLHVQLP